MTDKNKQMLEGYAASYSTMSKIGLGNVSASDVAYDIRNNMIPALTQNTFTAPDGEVWTVPTAEAYYRVCKARTKFAAFVGIQAVTLSLIKAAALKSDMETINEALAQLEYYHEELRKEYKNDR